MTNNVSWNPWHGCHKYSNGCVNCYVYRMDSRHDKDASIIKKTKNFDLPLKKHRDGSYVISKGSFVYTCFTSDLLLKEANPWLEDIWKMIKIRSDCMFFFITKRITELASLLPSDWGDGYPNVIIGCTMEDQNAVDKRLKVFLSLPLKHRLIICEPLLSNIDFHGLLNKQITKIVVGGESGNEARICKYEWVLNILAQAKAINISFEFKQTGALFEKDGKIYRIYRKDQFSQAKKAKINYQAIK